MLTDINEIAANQPSKAFVLVVDDEPFLRMAASDLVEEAGLTAIEAANADEAIGILESRDDIVAVFTDIDMPAGSMNGLRLAADVAERWPHIRIIIVSGHYHAGKGDIPEGSVFFDKPYPRPEILTQLARFAA